MQAQRAIMWDREHKRGRHLSCEPLVNPPAPPGIAQPQQRTSSADPGLQHAQHVFDKAPPVHKPGLLRLRVALAELAGLGCPLELFEATMGLAINDALHAHERHVADALAAAEREAGNGRGISLEDAGFNLPERSANEDVHCLSGRQRSGDAEGGVAQRRGEESESEVPAGGSRPVAGDGGVHGDLGPATLAAVFAKEDPKPAFAYAGLSAWLDQPKKE
jgi:hypothetical protein